MAAARASWVSSTRRGGAGGVRGDARPASRGLPDPDARPVPAADVEASAGGGVRDAGEVRSVWPPRARAGFRPRGEAEPEVFAAMHDLRAAGCQILTLGQYLQPTLKHLPVVEFVTPAKFEAYGRRARELGFVHAARRSRRCSRRCTTCEPRAARS